MSGEFSACGWSYRTEDALTEVTQCRPDLIILDINLPGRDGISLIPEILERVPGALIVVFTAHSSDPYASMAIKAGAHGFLSKTASPPDLISALRKVIRGDYHVEPSDFFRAMSKELSQREEEIYLLIGKGLSAAEIAVSLGLSSKTVDTHKLNIKGKLGIPDANSLLRSAVIEYERRRSAAKN